MNVGTRALSRCLTKQQQSRRTAFSRDSCLICKQCNTCSEKWVSRIIGSKGWVEKKLGKLAVSRCMYVHVKSIRLYKILLSRNWLLDYFMIFIDSWTSQGHDYFHVLPRDESCTKVTLFGTSRNCIFRLRPFDLSLTHNGTRARPFPREAWDHEDKVLISCFSTIPIIFCTSFYLATTIY